MNGSSWSTTKALPGILAEASAERLHVRRSYSTENLESFHHPSCKTHVSNDILGSGMSHLVLCEESHPVLTCDKLY